MATYNQRGQGHWQARIRRKGYPTQVKTFTTKLDAEAWAREVENEMDRSVFLSRKEAEQTSLEEAMDRFVAEYAPKYAQPRKVISRINALKKRPLAKRMLSSIQGKDIASHVRIREQRGCSPQTVLHEVNLLSRIFEVCRRDWGMESLRNPTKRINKPKQGKSRTRRLMWDEEEKLIEASVSELRPLILLALETAMRRGEIASIQWEDVSLQRKSIYLPRTKNGEPRTVPLSPAAIEIIAGLPRNIHGPVFDMHPDTVTKLFRRAIKKAGIEDLRFHDLRHEATSRLFENTDLDVMEIRAITGHKSLQMLARYNHLRTGHLADRLAGARRGT
ncbi:tyrosine-type recombinase/integrase [Desulfocurvus sp. DL9XJH121]